MKRAALILLIAVVLALAGCQATASGPPAPEVAETPDEAAVAAAVDEVFAEYSASMEAGDAERWLALWTEDGIQMPPGAPPNVGKEMIAKRVKGFLDSSTVEMDIEPATVIVAGDLALAQGMYTATFAPKDGSPPAVVDGKYYTTFQRQSDGSWKIYRDIFNSNVPPPAPKMPDEAAVAAAVEAMYTEYAASLEAGDGDRWAALWTDDGSQLIPDAPALVGKAALHEDILAFVDAFDVEMAIDTTEIEVAGDWAYASGLYTATLTPKDGSEPIPIDGKYLSIFQKQPDGSWKLHRDVYNSNVPPPAPEVAETPDEAAVAAAVDEIFAEYSASLEAGDAERWLALWAEDGIQMPPGAPPNVGKEMIEKRVRGNVENSTVEMDINTEEVIVAGDLALARGMYTVNVVPKDGSQPFLVDGKYYTTFQRQPDGSWKIYRDIFNSNVQ